MCKRQTGVIQERWTNNEPVVSETLRQQHYLELKAFYFHLKRIKKSV